MREIIKGLLWVGTARDSRDPQRWHELGVQAIVDLAIEETPCSAVREVIYLRIPILDGSGNSPATLRTAIDVTSYLIRHNTPALVCCSGGMSRSPAVVAAALSRVYGRSPEECLSDVVSGESLDVSPVLWNELNQAIRDNRSA